MIEGQGGGIKVTLSEAATYDIDILMSPKSPGIAGEVDLASFRIKAGETSFTLANAVMAKTDAELENDQKNEDAILFTARKAGGDELKFSNGTKQASLDLLVRDAVLAETDKTGVNEGIDAGLALLEYGRDLTEIAVDAFGKGEGAEFRSEIKKGFDILGKAVDAYNIAAVESELIQSLAAASKLDPSAKAHAEWKAYQKANVDLLDGLADYVFTSSGGAFAGGFAAGLLGAGSVFVLPVAVVGGVFGAILYSQFQTEVRDTLAVDFARLFPEPVVRSDETIILHKPGAGNVLIVPEGGSIDASLATKYIDHVYYRGIDKLVLPDGFEDATLLDPLSRTLPARFDPAADAGPELDGASVVGNALANRIEGNALGNALSGLAGNDVISGSGGEDRIRGDGGRRPALGRKRWRLDLRKQRKRPRLRQQRKRPNLRQFRKRSGLWRKRRRPRLRGHWQ